jgi:agmatinase
MTFDPNAAASGSGVYGLPADAAAARVVLVPVPFEATTSYGGGTAEGPSAILAASRQVDLHDHETGSPYEAGVVMLPESASVRAWNDTAAALARRWRDAREIGTSGAAAAASELEQVDRICAQLNAALHGEVASLLERGKIVGAVGGDHGSVFGAIAAHAERWPGLGILHIDAHADLRRAYEGFTWSHASIMENVVRRLPGVARLVQVGIRDFCDEERERIQAAAGRIRTWFDADMARERLEGIPWSQQVARIVADLPANVYVSFDIDGLEPTLCPHTGTPVPGGLSFHEASYLLGAIARAGRRIVGFDLVEVVPDPGGGEWDANVGARVLYKLIGWSLVSQVSAGGSPWSR